jgi:kumamolisin
MAANALDADTNVTGALASIVSAGYVAVGRYYSSNAAKRLTAGEAAAISAAGLKIFTVFEDSASPALNYESGVHDAQIALQQAHAVNQPAGSAIYFALDSELDTPALDGVRQYFSGIKDTIAGAFKLGVYGDGVVCQALLDDGTCTYTWLSASRGFPGSRPFYAGGRWSLAQDPDINQPFHGLSIDFNETASDFGGFQVGALMAHAAPGPAFHRVPRQGAHSQRVCLPYFKRGRSRTAAPGVANAGRWTVPDICSAYNWPTNLGGGGVIAIVEIDGGWVQSDMDAFFQSLGQPMPQIEDVSVGGGANKPGQHIGEESDPDIEVAMDIQIAAAAYFAATGKPAKLRVYWGRDTDASTIASAVRAATADGCDVCSISWGADEALYVQWGKQAGRDYVSDMEAAAVAATEAGMIVFAASGDNDSSDGGKTPANVDLPSSCPHVIGCGGTTKTKVSETVWNNRPGKSTGEGTGGGYSTLFPAQAWQTGAPHAKPGRLVPDIAAHADPNAGYWMFAHGNKMAMAGTSAVAPLYAGLFAAFGPKLGVSLSTKLGLQQNFITPLLWQNQNCFNDIVQGDNGEYQAQRGPDPCTGLGSPIASKIAALFSPAIAVPAPAATMGAAPVAAAAHG